MLSRKDLVIMSFEPKVKRRKWTDEEKHNTLKACNSRCSCCNKKLTLDTLTMEHVVPISKGGENVSENLVALCGSCNSLKSNKLCWPKGYYMALQNLGKLNVIEKYTKEWISANVDLEYIKEFPMVAETFSTILYPNNNCNTNKYVPQFIFDIFEITSETAGGLLKGLNLKRNDFLSTLVNKDAMFSLVGVKGRTSATVCSVYTVQFVDYKGYPSIVISEVYSSSTKAGTIIPENLLYYLTKTWTKFGINSVIVRAKDKRITDFVYRDCSTGHSKIEVNGYYGNENEFEYPDKDKWFKDGGQFYFIASNKMEDSLSDFKSVMRGD